MSSSVQSVRSSLLLACDNTGSYPSSSTDSSRASRRSPSSSFNSMIVLYEVCSLCSCFPCRKGKLQFGRRTRSAERGAECFTEPSAQRAKRTESQTECSRQNRCSLVHLTQKREEVFAMSFPGASPPSFLLCKIATRTRRYTVSTPILSACCSSTLTRCLPTDLA